VGAERAFIGLKETFSQEIERLTDALNEMDKAGALEHAANRCASSRDLVFPKIKDWDEASGRFSYDERYSKKQLDWTYAP
jgi:hypothetical protein